MRIEVMGSGCERFLTLYENTKSVVDELGLDATVSKVVKYGTMVPAIAVDGTLKSVGKVSSIDEIRELLIDMGKQ